MENLLDFFKNYGLPITIIAVVGIIILGVLKYCNLFKKIAENKRHYIYFAISVGLSVLATIIYLLIVGQLTAGYVVAIALAIYALNQTFYNIFKITPINELAAKLLDFIISLFKGKKSASTSTDAAADNLPAGDAETADSVSKPPDDENNDADSVSRKE
jgi:CBS domain containing-hemolysin-like protein|nr:MAG TPA: Protein of unknown function (DUF2659) [Caudoviricetes sp.]